MPVNKSAHDRYLIIDRCLTNRRNKYPKASFILEKIEDRLGMRVSKSTLDKDMAALRGGIYQAPIKFCKTYQGYYYERDDFSIRSFPLSDDEIEALDMAPAMLVQLKGSPLYENFYGAVNKVINGYRIASILGKEETDLIQVETATAEGVQWVAPLLKGIIEVEALALDYQSYRSVAKNHVFSPYLLKEYRNRWYVIGHSSRGGNVLVMGLDRIRNIRKTKEKFHKDVTFCAADYFRYSFGITQYMQGVPEKIELSFLPGQRPYLLSQPIHHSQQVIVDTSDEFRISIEVYRSPELISYILGNIHLLQDIRPRGLKEEVVQHLRAAATRLFTYCDGH